MAARMILHDLKSATNDLHHRLDTHPLLLKLLARDLTEQTYCQILQLFHGYYAAAEERLLGDDSQLAGSTFDVRAARKSHLLQQDLATFAQPLSDIRCNDLPDMSSMSAALGCLYVLEGSTLGGQMIAKFLRRSLGLDAANGAAFFNGYGADTYGNWERTRQFIEAQSQDETFVHSDALVAAQATFSSLERWLS